NLVEWYDFYAYTAFALYFANSFFPGNDPVIQQLNAAVVFAIGFVMRPIGGWLFGHLADHHGRRNALMLSVLLMCFGSLVIAVTPTYASIRATAPGRRASPPGLEPRWRVWRQRYLPHGSGRRQAPRLLCELSLRDSHRRSALRHPRAAASAAVFPDCGTNAGLGLAHPVRHRCNAGHRRPDDAEHSA